MPHSTSWRSFRTTAAVLIGLLQIAGCTSAKRLMYESARDAWQKPAEVIGALRIHPGDRIADLGSGSGFFTLRLSPEVGPEGKVFAVDIDEKMNQYLRGRLARAGAENVKVITARPDDPLLPDGGIDLVLNVITYHHIQNRATYFRNLKRDLAPGGRVAIIDFDSHSLPRFFGHYTPKKTLLCEMREAGYEVVESYKLVDCQTFMIFRPLPLERAVRTNCPKQDPFSGS